MKAITANRLRDGDVVFLGEGGRWVESFAEAALFARSDADAVLAAAKEKAEREQFGVDIYAFEVTEENGVPVPATMRERIRTAGPTVRTDLGKQAA
ncbi:DUF2849 domain-containing protein [Azospirillum sp. TSO35-2]|uniref:DUF2849 domain-containing protein n=1 Tax=Azospirillum sp. TSO35-2 TaxID=716796 RepID=UPI000D60F42C|nr:DUF2849 domain-containing protein [Azospirillum sp. TSO35-2]PWC34654.1 hypothetical protein TSO352_24685 [Azospirillum sp. TSO35-2]